LHRHALRAKVIVLGRDAVRYFVPVAHIVGGCATHRFLDACAVGMWAWRLNSLSLCKTYCGVGKCGYGRYPRIDIYRRTIRSVIPIANASICTIARKIGPRSSDNKTVLMEVITTITILSR
jgi:hypothetical protein